MIGVRALWWAAAGCAAVGLVLLLTSDRSPARAPWVHAAATGAQRVAPGSPAQPAPGNGPRAGHRSAGPTGTSPSPSISPAGEPPAPVADVRWRPVATGFARDFAHPGSGAADWLARVRRWTSPYLAEQYRHTDPYRIPSGSLVTVEPAAKGDTVVTFVATYDTGLSLTCRVELGPTGWKVTSAAPATRSPGRGA